MAATETMTAPSTATKSNGSDDTAARATTRSLVQMGPDRKSISVVLHPDVASALDKDVAARKVHLPGITRSDVAHEIIANHYNFDVRGPAKAPSMRDPGTRAKVAALLAAIARGDIDASTIPGYNDVPATPAS